MCCNIVPDLRPKISNTLRTMINSSNFWNIKIYPFPKIILVCLSMNILFMIVDEMPWNIIYILITRALRFISWIETELSVFSNSSKEDFLSLYIKRWYISRSPWKYDTSKLTIIKVRYETWKSPCMFAFI